MARPLRIDIRGGLYHVTNRGWERRSIFTGDCDRADWLRLLDRVATRCHWEVFCWVLMQNHYHLFLRTPDANLSAGMHDLNSGYASLYNRRHHRSGALFQGRFKAVLVERDGHAAEVSRYLHLNPVRAGIVRLPEHYPWSSYRCYRFARFASAAPAWLDWHTILAEYSLDIGRARQGYRKFVESGISLPLKSPTEGAVGGVFLGSAGWVEDRRQELARGPRVREVPQRQQLKWRPCKKQIINTVCTHLRVDHNTLYKARQHRNEARLAVLYLLRHETDTTVAQLAAEFGRVSSAAVCKALARAESRRKTDPAWNALLTELLEKLREPLTNHQQHPRGRDERPGTFQRSIKRLNVKT
jgi:putative transposase